DDGGRLLRRPARLPRDRACRRAGGRPRFVRVQPPVSRDRRGNGARPGAGPGGRPFRLRAERRPLPDGGGVLQPTRGPREGAPGGAPRPHDSRSGARMSIRVETPDGADALREFVLFHDRVYAYRAARWSAPLDLYLTVLRGGPPFGHEREIRPFWALDRGEIVARAAAVLDRRDHRHRG